MSLLWKIFTLQCQKTLLTFRSLIITRASSLDKYSHSQCGKSRNSLTPKKYLGIQLFRENVAFTIFVSKKCEIVISIFFTLWYLFKHNLPYLVVVKVTLITKYIHKRCFTSAFFCFHRKKCKKLRVLLAPRAFHSVESKEIYSHHFYAKIEWKQHC